MADAEVKITIHDMTEESIYALIYGQELWPEVVTEILDAEVVE